MTKASKFNNQLTTKKHHQNFDYTTIADRLRTASWSNNNHPTGVVLNGLRVPNPPTNHKSRVIKSQKITIIYKLI